MRFSIWPTTSQPWADVLEVVTHAEATGWHRAYLADHFMPDGETAADDPLTPMLEATAGLAALAGATERIGLASLVFGITYRHPAVLANWAATVDHVSGGRFVLGVGAGWQENEHDQYGIDLGPPGARIERFVEALSVIRGLLADRVTNLAGEHYRLTDAIAEPKPVGGSIPLLIGGKRPRMLGVVADYADEWNMWALPDVIGERRAALDAACADRGRDPAEITTSTQALWFIDDDQAAADARVAASGTPAAIGGPLERLTDTVAAWRDVGVDELIVPDFTLGRGAERRDAMDAIIERIAPQFAD